MNDWLVSKCFIAASFGFFGLVFWLLIHGGSEANPGLAILAAAVCALLGNIRRIASFKATATSVEAQMREVAEVVDEAKATLKSLHQVAAMAGATLIELDATMGRIGGSGTPAMKDERKQRIIQSLSSISLSEKDLEKVANADKEWVSVDYCLGIFLDWSNDKNRTPQEKAAWGEFSESWKGPIDQWPSPEKCRVFMDKLNINDAVLRDFLEDYQFYKENSKHRRPDVWRDRDRWLHMT